MTKVYSNDGEDTWYDDLGSLIDYRDEPPQVGDTYWEADKVEHKASRYYCVHRMLDQMADEAQEKAGEFADDFPNLSVEASQELQERIAAIIDELVPVNFFTVANAVEMKLEKEDLVSICSNCSGSGEGQYEGARCTACFGKGEC